ncbi:hypothetical protein R3P38DRAFT_3200309 [Favolaschia claudopus]|uniref:Uncharacterized protein n=1 Tax=Favolaschia claudopus TaxID=2862362 RepID=A0AAW0AZN5_9AGAR
MASQILSMMKSEPGEEFSGPTQWNSVEFQSLQTVRNTATLRPRCPQSLLQQMLLQEPTSLPDKKVDKNHKISIVRATVQMCLDELQSVESLLRASQGAVAIAQRRVNYLEQLKAYSKKKLMHAELQEAVLQVEDEEDGQSNTDMGEDDSEAKAPPPLRGPMADDSVNRVILD